MGPQRGPYFCIQALPSAGRLLCIKRIPKPVPQVFQHECIDVVEVVHDHPVYLLYGAGIFLHQRKQPLPEGSIGLLEIFRFLDFCFSGHFRPGRGDLGVDLIQRHICVSMLLCDAIGLPHSCEIGVVRIEAQ